MIMTTCETVTAPFIVSTLRVLIVDDHAMLRDAVKAALTEQGFDVIGEATDGRQAIEQCAELQPDVAVIELSIPLLDGFAATREIVRRSPHVKVVILTMHAQHQYVRESLDAGASGFVLKADSAVELAEALRTVANGNRYITRSLLVSFEDARPQCSVTKNIALADRERQVLALIAQGNDMKQIGAQLGISFKTVQSHRENIMKKLKIRNTASLVVYAMRSGLIKP